MKRFRIISWLYVRAVIVTAAIMSLLFIPTAGMYFPMVFVISIIVGAVCFIPIGILLLATIDPVFRLNYSFSSCLVFYGFLNAAIGAIVINSFFFLVVRSLDQELLIANSACVILAWSGCYLSRNSLREYFREAQLLKKSPFTMSLPQHEQDENEADTNGSEFDPYTISLN